MNTIKTLAISTLAFWAIALVLEFALGILILPVLTTLLLPALILAIHLISAIALFNESKRRKEEGGELFADLDAPFWAIIGLAFGILGLLAFRLLNDQFKERPKQSR